MKKMLLGSITLMIFSIAIILFQVSCQKELGAQSNQGSGSYTLPAATASKLGGVIVGEGLNVTANGILSVDSSASHTPLKKIVYQVANSSTEIWTMNYDGTENKKVNISLPDGQELTATPRLSPDGKALFFTAFKNLANPVENMYYTVYIYSCKLDGSDLKLLTSFNAQNSLELGGVY